jgi:hypothetical protein
MTPLLSNLIVIALVAAAAAVMGRRALRMLRGTKTGCGCERCPVGARGGAKTAPAAGPPPAAAGPPPATATSATAQRGA